MGFERVISVRLQAKVDGFVSSMRSARKSVDDLTKADVPKLTKAFDDLANKAAFAGTAVASGVGLAVKQFADFDQAMSAVKANSGATGAQLDALRASAVKLGADSQFSATEAAQGINELAKAGVQTGDILGGALKGSLDLAAAGQHARHLAQIDVAHQATLQRTLDVNLLHGPLLHHRHAGFVRSPIDQYFLSHGLLVSLASLGLAVTESVCPPGAAPGQFQRRAAP